MSKTKIPIIWENELVGYIENPKQWPVVWRGRWIPVGSTATKEFLAAFQTRRPVWVEFGIPPVEFGTIETAPGDEVEIRLTIDDSDTQPTEPLRVDRDKRNESTVG